MIHRRDDTRGEPRLHETSVEFEVPFHHVDALQIVWHGHYLKYFEKARTALLRSRNLDAGELVGARYRLVVVESLCRHGFPLAYGDRVRASAWFGDYARRLMIRYEVVNLTHDRRAAHGHTAIGALDETGRLLLEIPEPIARRIRD
jgi:acyl-CoA thioester hydrolase